MSYTLILILTYIIGTNSFRQCSCANCSLKCRVSDIVVLNKKNHLSCSDQFCKCNLRYSVFMYLLPVIFFLLCFLLECFDFMNLRSALYLFICACSLLSLCILLSELFCPCVFASCSSLS